MRVHRVLVTSWLLLSSLMGLSHAFITGIDVSRVKSILERTLADRNIPDKVSKFATILQKHLHILDCLPTKKISSTCYEAPRYCPIPSMKLLGKPVQIKVAFCKRPWKLMIYFQLPKLPWYARWGFGPIVIPMNTYDAEGVTKITSVATGKAVLLGILKTHKAALKIDGIIRWDCTKPRGLYNLKRLRYNTGYNDGKSGLDYNKIYYKLKIRMEVKKKRFPCFCYKCMRGYCRDLINTQGDLGSGPTSCIADTIRLADYRQDLLEKRKRLCKFGQCREIP